MERELLGRIIVITLFCASFIIIDALGHSSRAENYELVPDRMLANVDHPGFISIDCGSSIDYTDEETGIWYQRDESFIETGTNYNVSSDANLSYPYIGKRLNTLRCFPNGERNCYTLSPEKTSNSNNNSNKYLIRALFSYGNYDGKNQIPSFDFYLGVNLWDTINKVGDCNYYIAETIYTQSLPSDDSIQVCLVKSGPTIPCISSLELRPLDSSIYDVMSTTSTSQPLMRLMLRIDAGSASTQPVHSLYKDDVYDRIWRYDKDVNGWNLYNTTKLDDSTSIDPESSSNAYRLPPQVFSTAISSNVISYTYEFPAPEDSFEYYLLFHFAEIEQLPIGSKRVINITLNSKNVLSEPLSLEYLKPKTIVPEFTVKGYINFIISSTAESDVPPILNAFEMYKLIELNSTTDARDVGAIVDIKGAYKISRLSWQGDPCLPMKYAWEGLNCSSDTIPRITSLNLRSSNLKGVINSSFSYLTELIYLDLSDNELEGALPEFLAELPKLKALNLTGNKFSGEIPKALKMKAETERTLLLSMDNNPDLCTTDSCNKKKNLIILPIVASLSALIVIFLITLGGFWIFKRRHQRVEARINSSTKGRTNSSIKGGNSLESRNRAFSYNGILNMTDNLRTIIGEGGFGKVYLGILQNHVQVAVKLLSSSSVQGFREFRSETQLLSLVHHRNLVSLIGYCEEGDIKALIYEYMPNGNLHQHLSDKNPDALK